MGVTFDLTDKGTTRSQVYCHITDVMGPKKDNGLADDVVGRWYATFGVHIHENQTARNNDVAGWPDSIPLSHVDRFKWRGGNLDSYPTLAVLYATLKTELANIRVNDAAICSNIQDAI